MFQIIFFSVADIAAQVGFSKVKIPLDIKVSICLPVESSKIMLININTRQGPANISVVNTNSIDAEKFTVALYVANRTLGEPKNLIPP